jgi:CRISPR-associated endonuclease/helicase Cas3
MVYAHSINELGERHGLEDHLRATAELARGFADAFGAGDLAYHLGLWHDVGKFNPEFQHYLFRCEQEPRARGHGPDHKAAGAKLALQHVQLLALPVQGHHGGLRTPNELSGFLADSAKDPACDDAVARARQALPEVDPSATLELPRGIKTSEISSEMFLRMVFSCLVDADYLDTEAHFDPRKAGAREPGAAIRALWDRFEGNQTVLMKKADGDVNRIRHEVYESCLRAAESPPGMFRLTVPTGGGKTRSGMAFALQHALRHGQRRVIVVLPFITITQQTAKEYRGIFDRTEDVVTPVLEHHSGGNAVDADEHGDFHAGQVWARLAAENWDAPIVVTTTVQLFESLFSNMPSHTRKLHNLARSVIILDEAQTLPVHRLRPILSALRELCENYGTTIVLSTATQPAFEVIREFADVPATEIVPESARHFRELSRVGYEWRTDRPTSWGDIANEMRSEEQVLAIVNTKKDALALLAALDDSEALHLSTLLCGLHRQDVIEKVRLRLGKDEPCRLVSTQVVEAGVDLDFPLVLRAMGPLDSIIQSAGRCNREGLLERGRVVVFKPEGGGLPPGPYRTATDITAAMLRGGAIDPDDPATAREYLARVYNTAHTDREGIQALRARFEYPEVAQRFRMIDDDTESVVVTSYGPARERTLARRLLDNLKQGAPNARSLMRQLQPFLVSVYQGQTPVMARDGLLAEVMPGLWEWRGHYDSVTGIGGVTSLSPDDLVL